MKLPTYTATRPNEAIYNDSINKSPWDDETSIIQLLALFIGLPACIGMIAISVYIFISGLFH